jgi:predicted short-subunit dehydrogenase-like oxidoreductase (DUF2520 family)
MPEGGTSVRIIGPGRAGGALALALDAAGWTVLEPVQHGDPLAGAAAGVDVLVIAVPDGAVAEVASAVEPVESTVVVHVSGALGLDALAPHPRRAGLHPLVSMPSAEVGAARLRGAWFAVAGDPVAVAMATALEGRTIDVADGDRVIYHAAACIAANHLVALLGSVERLADGIGVPLDAYLELVRGAVDNVALLGPTAALTGPAARGDDATVERHRAALTERAPDELAAYDALVALARRLAASRPPPAP